MLLILFRATAVCLAVLGASTANAALVDFTFTLTKALSHGGESIGGAASPLAFVFRVDDSAPNLNEPSTSDGVYGFGYGAPGAGFVNLGSTETTLAGGALRVSNATGLDVFEATANGPDDGTRMLGRSLFVASAVVWDFSGQMFSDVALPSNTDFAAYIGGGFFQLTFRALESDPEFATDAYVKFDTFISPSDVLITRTFVGEVPEPATSSLALLALVLAISARRLSSRSESSSSHSGTPRGDA
jgi:hypothetical protein